MELCGDLIERVHENINSQQSQSDAQESVDDQVAEIASEAKAQARSQSSMDSTDKKAAISSKANGSGPSMVNASRYVLCLAISSLLTPVLCGCARCRNTSSAPAYTRCSAPVILFKKLHRPWLKHLEENKNLWQVKAAEGAFVVHVYLPVRCTAV